jgi:hypothetical protein
MSHLFDPKYFVSGGIGPIVGEEFFLLAHPSNSAAMVDVIPEDVSKLQGGGDSGKVDEEPEDMGKEEVSETTEEGEIGVNLDKVAKAREEAKQSKQKVEVSTLGDLDSTSDHKGAGKRKTCLSSLLKNQPKEKRTKTSHRFNLV